MKCAFPFSCSSEREQLLLDCAVFVSGTGKAGIQRKVFKRASCFWVKKSTQEEWQESEVHFQPIVFPPTLWTRSLSARVCDDGWWSQQRNTFRNLNQEVIHLGYKWVWWSYSALFQWTSSWPLLPPTGSQGSVVWQLSTSSLQFQPRRKFKDISVFCLRRPFERELNLKGNVM